jgi:hypothetical protein
MGERAAQPGDDPTAAMLRMMRGYWISQAIFTAVRFGVADLLADGPRTPEDLAAATGIPTASLARLLRALAGEGVFADLGDAGYGQTPLSDCLRSDAPESLRASGIVMGEVLFPAWVGLADSLRSGRPSFSDRFGAEFFPYLNAHPHLGSRFQEMMADLNSRTNAAIPVAYDFTRLRHVVDIGGGKGSLLAAILQAYSQVRGTLFDLPDVVEQARINLTEAGVVERCEVIGGDFFTGVPTGADAYILRWILHDFDDDRAVKILRACRAAIAPEGRLLVVERMVEPGADPASRANNFQDLQMLILLGGKERTEEEFSRLFEAAGFALRRTIPTGAALRILEGVPA